MGLHPVHSGRKRKKRMTKNPLLDRNRLVGIDLGRILAACAVISIHGLTIYPASGVAELPAGVFVALCRFAVPFFFVASGYFYARRIRQGTAPSAAFRAFSGRLLTLYGFWSLVYFVDPPLRAIADNGIIGAYGTRLEDLASRPVHALFVGPGFHLWFFVSLWCAAAVFHLMRAHRTPWLCAALGLLLYGFGVLAKAYDQSPCGIELAFDTRNGPFFSVLPFLIGAMIYDRRTEAPHSALGWGLALGGAVGHVAESTALYQLYGLSFGAHDYVFSTVFMGVGLFLILLPVGSATVGHRLARLGRVALGMYAIHPLVLFRIDLFESLVPAAVWIPFAIAAAIVASAIVALILARFGATARFVT